MNGIPWAVEPFFALIDELRRSGFNLGTNHYVAVQDLLLALRALGDWPQDAETLKGFLAPVLCSSESEQKRFEHLYWNWLRMQTWSDSGSEAAQDGSASRRPHGPTLALVRLLLGGLAALILAAALLHYLPISPQNRGKAGEVGTQEPPSPEPLHVLLDHLTEFRNRRSVEIPIKRSLWERLVPSYTRAQQLLVPFACLLLIAAWQTWLRQNKPILERESVLGNPRLWPIVIHPWVERLFSGGECRRTIRELRRRQCFPDAGLDVEKTAQATAALAGFLTPVPSQRKVSPEYLMLIDRASSRDQQAEYFNVVTARLKESGAHAVHYYFDGDPRHCIPPNNRRPHRTLSGLASRFPEHRLLILSDGRGLVDPVEASPRRWVELFDAWKLRAVLTPERPGNWGQREAALASAGFLVLPAGFEGLQGLAEAIESEPQSGWPCDPWSSFPDLLSERPQEWVHREAPNPVEIEHLCLQLRNYLDREGYLWLCACAVYPELHWNLTLALVRELEGLEGMSEVVAPERLLSLTRLPWFRHGSMPDWLRSRLIDELSPRQAQAVRQAIYEMLARAEAGTAFEREAPAADGLQLDIARRQGSRLRQLWKKRPPRESALRDQVFLKLMLGGRLAKLAVRTPRLLWKLVYREGSPLLGLRPTLVVAVLSFLGLFGWAALGESRPGTRSLQPEAIPSFRPVEGAEPPRAESTASFQHYYREFHRSRESDPSIADFLSRQGADPSGIWNGSDPVQDQTAEEAFSLYQQWLQGEIVKEEGLPADSFYLSRGGQSGWVEQPILLFPIAPEVGIWVLGPESVTPREQVEYQVRVENSSPAEISELLVTFFPGGLSYLKSSLPTLEEEGEPTWRIPGLPAGSSLKINVTALAPAGGEFRPCARVSSLGLHESATCRPVVSLPQPGQLSVKLTGPSQVIGCGPVGYQVEVLNAGQSPLSDVQAQVEVPPGLSLSQDDSTVLQAGSLRPGGSRTFRLDLRAVKGGLYKTSLRFNCKEGFSAEGTQETVFQPARLQVQSTLYETLKDSELLLKVENVGPAAAENVTVRYRMPKYLEFLKADQGGLFAAGYVLWKFPSMSPSEAKALTADFKFIGFGNDVDLGDAQAWADCAEEASGSVPPDPVEAGKSAAGALTLQIADSQDPIQVGRIVTYLLVVANPGQAVCSGLEIQVQLPSELAYFQSDPPPRVLQPVDGGTIRFQIPPLQPGGKTMLRVNARARSPGQFAIRAEAVASGCEAAAASAAEQTRIIQND